ncbi:MAG: thiamine phosphate synthase [Chloracidobacterium sp.]|nr:thiamine phosphate synthase [Chloracidobacterium sp.]
MSLSFDGTIIYLITKGEATPANFDAKSGEILDIIRLAVEEKVSLVQIREKALTARLLIVLASRAAEITRGSATRLLVNDRADIAMAAGADGVHLAADSLAVDVVRSNFPKKFIIGASTRSFEEAAKASEADVDFAVFGPVFETPGKGQPKGLAELSEVCDRLPAFPVLALGGIDEGNISSVLDAGAAGFAAIRALNDPESLRSICRQFRK